MALHKASEVFVEPDPGSGGGGGLTTTGDSDWAWSSYIFPPESAYTLHMPKTRDALCLPGGELLLFRWKKVLELSSLTIGTSATWSSYNATEGNYHPRVNVGRRSTNIPTRRTITIINSSNNAYVLRFTDGNYSLDHAEIVFNISSDSHRPGEVVDNKVYTILIDYVTEDGLTQSSSGSAFLSGVDAAYWNTRRDEDYFDFYFDYNNQVKTITPGYNLSGERFLTMDLIKNPVWALEDTITRCHLIIKGQSWVLTNKSWINIKDTRGGTSRASYSYIPIFIADVLLEFVKINGLWHISSSKNI